jgi:hypothetical protein
MKSYREKRKRSNARWKEWDKSIKKLSGDRNKKYFLFDDVTETYVKVDDYRMKFKDFWLTDKESASSYSIGLWEAFLTDFGHRGKFRLIRK